MDMNKCMIVIMLFVAVSQAEDVCLNTDPSSRIECGFAGITESTCKERGCCFDNSISGVKWCFKKPSKERIDLSEAVVGTPQYFQSGTINVENLRKLVDGDSKHNFVKDCIAAEKGAEPAYFQLDMLREVEVVSVELLGRDDAQWGGKQLSNFKIHTSKKADADASNLCATQTGNGDYTKFNTYACAQPMKGRYISIISTAVHLSLCEIRVNGKLVNPDSFVDMSTALVKTGPTFQNKPANRMNDGDLSQDFLNKCTAATNDADNAIWIQFDMGSVQTVGSVELLARNDQWGVPQLKDFSIYVAEKDQTSASNLCTQAGSTASLIAYNTYRCQNQMQGRYLTIRKNSAPNDYISICEIKVNTKGSLNDKVEVSGSSGTCGRKKQCMAKTR